MTIPSPKVATIWNAGSTPTTRSKTSSLQDVADDERRRDDDQQSDERIDLQRLARSTTS